MPLTRCLDARSRALAVSALAVVAAIACSSDHAAPAGAGRASEGAAGSGGATLGGSDGGGAGAGGAATAGAGDGGSGDTWTTYAKGFFSTYCVSCHGASDTARDFRTIDHVRRDAAIIRCGVATTALPECPSFPPPRQFPIGTGPKPDDAARARLLAWLDAGLPE